MAKKGSTATAKSDVVYKAPCRYGTGSWSKTRGSLGCKIAAKLCNSKRREELFVNSTLRVRLSSDPEAGTDQLPGMEDAYESLEITVKVTKHSTDESDVSFSLSFDKEDMPSEFLKSLSHSIGSVYVLSVTYNEDPPAGKDADEE